MSSNYKSQHKKLLFNKKACKSSSEANLRKKELKLQKKELSLRKKEIIQQQKVIRAGYTDHIRRIGSKVRGGGKLGKIVRGVQTLNRDNKRRELARDLKPLEDEKQFIELEIFQIEKAILEIEKYLADHKHN